MTRWEQEGDPPSPGEPFPTRRELRSRRDGYSTRAERHRARRRRWPFVVAGVVTAAVVGGLAMAYANLDGNIDRIDIAGAVGTERPTAEVEGPLNILVMGSDDRQGLGTIEYGRDTVEGGAQSDTNLLVHLSADRERAMVVSIPRDSMVKAPQDCSDLEASVEDGVVRQWNKNFNQGGPACVIRTLEGNTQIRIDHFVVIDFMGFRSMVDALGGIEVCLPEDVKDPQAQFEKAAGRHVLDGREALGYVRMRKSVGDGSDLGRIERQQTFLTSVAQKATSTSLLLRPDRLYSFLDAATESMTTDSELGTTQMARIAQSVRSIGLDKVEFVTVPTEQYPQDPNRVQWSEDADALWDAIRLDRPLTEEEEASGTSTLTPTPPSQPLTVAPDQISVMVSNAAGVRGLATQTVRALTVQGFVAMAGVDIPRGQVEGTVIRHGAAQADAARTVQAAFPGSVLVADETIGSSIVIQMGSGAVNPIEVPNRLGFEPLPPMPVSAEHVGGATSSPSISVRTADEDICG